MNTPPQAILPPTPVLGKDADLHTLNESTTIKPPRRNGSISASPHRTYAEPYSVPPTNISVNEDELPNKPEPPKPRTLLQRIVHPTGIQPNQMKYEHWVGRVGFGAKALVYSFVGGMTVASAARLDEMNGSPQGAFVLIGTFAGGTALLVIMLLALGCYIAWRWWECFLFQGADATFSPFKNFFAYRLSPFVSGCVYIAYSYYIIQILANDNKPSCYPECWRHTKIGKAGLVLFGIAFAIACVTQLLNAFTRKWHPEMNWPRCNKFEKYLVLALGHTGFVGRAGLFLFVSVLMFRSLNPKQVVQQGGNTIANGLNQLIGTGVGRAFMVIVGMLTLLYGCFALLCTRYRYFPTPPPSGRPLYSVGVDPVQQVETVVKDPGAGNTDVRHTDDTQGPPGPEGQVNEAV